MNKVPVSLVNLSSQEKVKAAEMSTLLLKRGILMYFLPFIFFTCFVGFFNVKKEVFGLEESPEIQQWINVAFVFLTILLARLFVNILLQHKKATNAWQKKVIRGKIVLLKGKQITVANQKIKLSALEISKLSIGDEVIVSTLPTVDIVLEIEMLSAKK